MSAFRTYLFQQKHQILAANCKEFVYRIKMQKLANKDMGARVLLCLSQKLF